MTKSRFFEAGRAPALKKRANEKDRGTKYVVDIMMSLKSKHGLSINLKPSFFSLSPPPSPHPAENLKRQTPWSGDKGWLRHPTRSATEPPLTQEK